MDIPRKSPNKTAKRIVFSVGAFLILMAITLGLSRMKPAVPSVDRSGLWTDTVKRGSMVRQVRGSGTLVPQQVQWIPAATEGRVIRIHTLPGTPVEPTTILLELSNAELELQTRDAELQLRAAEAELANQRVQLENQRMNQEALVAEAKAESLATRLRADADEQLAREGLVADINLRVSRAKADEMQTKYEIEQRKVMLSADSIRAQLEVQKAKVDQMRAAYELRRVQFKSLQVRAGIDGVLQQMQVQVGQRVAIGSTLAKVVQPERLKAELKIAETQAKDIQIGQTVLVDTRNGVINGRVIRIDPAVQNGTVTVDVALDGTLPKGARPDLTVDGTIELERLANVLYIGRPALGQEHGTVSLFKLTNNGKRAQRTTVKLGRSSVNYVEVIAGLKEGDIVILSDLSALDEHDELRID